MLRPMQSVQRKDKIPGVYWKYLLKFIELVYVLGTEYFHIQILLDLPWGFALIHPL